jgi:hypothetical protein
MMSRIGRAPGSRNERQFDHTKNLYHVKGDYLNKSKRDMETEMAELNLQWHNLDRILQKPYF